MKQIECMVRAYGYINRRNIELMFRVSTPQAAADIRMLQKCYNNLLEYNTSTKRYEQVVPIL